MKFSLFLEYYRVLRCEKGWTDEESATMAEAWKQKRGGLFDQLIWQMAACNQEGRRREIEQGRRSWKVWKFHLSCESFESRQLMRRK